MELRNKGITDMAVLGAMERVARDAFVPEAVKDQAWEDIALPIGLGQTISQPLVVAMMTQALALSDMDQVLEIGTGCGYQTAVLARLARRVYTIERHRPLADGAAARLESMRVRNVTAICGDGMRGWPNAGVAPFQKIIVTAAARDKPPQALMDQLAVGGVMIIPIGGEDPPSSHDYGGTGGQELRLYKKESDEAYAVKVVGPVRFVPLLPNIA
jgi:protein-L-isoaspartate(D-aspartate) O-methyltransferase